MSLPPLAMAEPDDLAQELARALALVRQAGLTRIEALLLREQSGAAGLTPDATESGHRPPSVQEAARLYNDLLEENQQRRATENALRESKATLLQAERINRSGSFTWEIGGSVLTCSAECCRIFGFDAGRRAVPFDAFLERIHPDDRERVVLHVASCLAQKQAVSIDYRIVRDGALRFISSVGEPVGRDGEIGMYVGTAIDITARRAAEDSLRAAQAELARVARVTTVGQLSASIAHEVSQPLTSISSNAGASLRWLERDPPRLDEVRRGLLEIEAQSQRAGGIIQGLVALTRKALPMVAPVDLHAAVRHILSMSRGELERHDVVLSLALDAGSGWVAGDAVQLQQVLLNIVVNAVDAMSAVCGRARQLRIASRSDGQGRIELRVDDAGIGIGADPAAQQQLFEAFYSTKDKGMGMGLAICRAIVEAHGGAIALQARQPHGCTILFNLPETPPPASQ